VAKVLAVLGSGRTHGYTASLLQAALEGLGKVEGVEGEVVHLARYQFSPCTSCFACIREPGRGCILPDDMGWQGELYRKAKAANALLVVDAVHLWGPTAYAHLFMERLYPMLWSGELEGLPFATISCASNQGMQIIATRDLCKWALGYGLRYIEGLPVHTTYLEEAKREACFLGRRLAEASLRDAREGRQKFADDEERYLYYADKPWTVLEPYIENLSRGTFRWEDSLPEYGLRQGTFHRPEAIELLEKASFAFREVIRSHDLKDLREALKHLARASLYWTNATWKEFLEEGVIGAAQPEAYRPLSQLVGKGEEQDVTHA